MKTKNEDKITFEVRDLRNGEWLWIHKWVIKEFGRIIKASGIAIYACLSGFSHHQNQSSFPKYRQIAYLLGCSRPTVQRKTRQLKELKLIRIDRVDQYHYIYYLLKNPNWNFRPESRGIKNDTSGNPEVSKDNGRGIKNDTSVYRKEQELINNKGEFSKKEQKKENKSSREAIEKVREKLRKKGILKK